jgi:homoserine kinase type II
LIREGFSNLESVLERSGSAPLVPEGRRWIEIARAVAPAVLDALRRASALTVWRQPCLRDVRPEHLLFTGERVTGLVDFGAMGFDTVAADLARLIQEWIGSDSTLRAEALNAYTAVRPLDPTETLLIEAFQGSTALLGAGRWVRWHFVEGRVFEEPNAVDQGIRKGLARLVARFPACVSAGRADASPGGQVDNRCASS